MPPNGENKCSTSSSTPRTTATPASSLASRSQQTSHTSSTRPTKSISSLRMYDPGRPPTRRDQLIAAHGLSEVHRAERREIENNDPRRPQRASDVILHADLRDMGVLGALLKEMIEEGVEEAEKTRRLVEMMGEREARREEVGDGARYEGAI